MVGYTMYVLRTVHSAVQSTGHGEKNWVQMRIGIGLHSEDSIGKLASHSKSFLTLMFFSPLRQSLM